MSIRLPLAALAASALTGGIAVATVPSASAVTARRASLTAVLKVASVKVAIGSTTKDHPLLVTAKGLPVYLLTGDSVSHPRCAGASCLAYWPAVTTTARRPALGPGIKAKVGVWHHNRINQVTLNGHPLYTFARDGRDAAHGEGVKSFGGVWELVTAQGTAMARTSSSSSSGSSSYSSSSSSGSAW